MSCGDNPNIIYIARAKANFMTKYKKLFGYIVRAMGLKEDEFRLNFVSSSYGIGFIVFQTDDIYISIGNEYSMTIRDDDLVTCRWCRNIGDPSGGFDKSFYIRDLQDPQKILGFFGELMNEKYKTREFDASSF